MFKIELVQGSVSAAHFSAVYVPEQRLIIEPDLVPSYLSTSWHIKPQRCPVSGCGSHLNNGGEFWAWLELHCTPALSKVKSDN